MLDTTNTVTRTVTRGLVNLGSTARGRASLRRLAALTVAFGALTLSAPTASAVDIRIEVSPLVAVPVAPFLDSQVVPELQLQTNIGVAELASVADFTHSVGGGIALAVLFNDFEVRYEFMALAFSKQRFTHLGVILNDVALYAPIGNGPDDITPNDLANLGLGSDIERDASSLDSVFIHNIGVGWRLVPFDDWTVQPYLPFALGMSIAQLRNGIDPILGFYIQLGAGVQYSPLDWLRLGLEVRYNFAAYKNPDLSISAITRSASGTLTTNFSAFDSVMEDLQTVNIGFTAAFKL